ncbi:MAG: hypothetical protein WDA59_08790 [Methanofastidiosum sp.]
MNAKINLNNYLDRLVGKIYKALCILEENPENAKKYLNSLTVELDGFTHYYSDDSYIISTLFSLQGIKQCTDHNVWRKTVLECIDNVNKLKAKLNN